MHPEDTETTEEDLTDITIRNVLTDGIYNDIGFRNRDRDVLAEYLKTRESEVVSIMMMLFDDAYIQRAYHMRVEREAAEKAKIAAEKEVRAMVEKEVVLASLQATMENAAKMIRAGRVNMDEIPQFFPQLSQEDVEKLRQMADA